MESQPELKWQVQLPGGASGGPAVYTDGTVVAAGTDNVLMAFTPQGDVLWESPLDAMPIGAPALDAQGRIFVADFEGHVTAFDAQGTRLWRVEASATRQATSGPIVSSSGMIYLTLIDAVVGISPDGQLVWRVTATDEYVEAPPRLSADESLVFLKSTAMDARTGQIQTIQIRPENEILFTEPAFFAGVDGRNYYRNGHEVMRWQMTESGPQVEEPVSWEYQSFVLFNPLTQGVTANRLAWMFYSSDFNDGRMVWMDEQSRLVGNYRFPHGSSRLIAMGANGEAYLCGPTGARIECVAAFPGSEEPLWSVFLDNPARPIGGALVPGTLYVTAEDGTLYALSTEDNPQP
jgi:outer membrane protein assembly factor BamB